jgi:Cytochrome P450
VLPALTSANRDDSVYADPDLLDLAREEASHVGFGHGPHHCLGAPLARMELQVALDVLLRRLPGLRFDERTAIDWKNGLATRGPAHMAIMWDEPARAGPAAVTVDPHARSTSQHGRYDHETNAIEVMPTASLPGPCRELGDWSDADHR